MMPLQRRAIPFVYRRGHVAMNLYVPGSPPDIGRKRPYTIGDLADVETARRMYPYITPHHAKTKGESMGFAYCLGHV
jgi:hypothetical protein